MKYNAKDLRNTKNPLLRRLERMSEVANENKENLETFPKRKDFGFKEVKKDFKKTKQVKQKTNFTRLHLYDKRGKR